VKSFNWNEEKNRWLKENLGIGFEDIVFLISGGNLIEVVKHPSPKYANQLMFVINLDNYIYLVPFVTDGSEKFLKTIIPSRKATKKDLGGKKDEK